MSETGAMSWKQRGRWAKTQRPPDEPKRSNHKDTKKWCKGVKGREHNYVWVPDLRHHYSGHPTYPAWYKHECTKCQKQDDYCWPACWNDRDDIKDRCKCGFHLQESNKQWKIK